MERFNFLNFPPLDASSAPGGQDSGLEVDAAWVVGGLGLLFVAMIGYVALLAHKLKE